MNASEPPDLCTGCRPQRRHATAHGRRATGRSVRGVVAASVVGSLVTLLAACDDHQPERPAPPVIRLIGEIENASVQSVLEDRRELPAEAPGGDLLDEQFTDRSRTAWEEVDLEHKSVAAAPPEAWRPTDEGALFPPRKDRFLFRRLAVPPGVVLTCEVYLRRPPGSDPASPSVFLNEYRGDQVFGSFHTLVRAKKLASLVPQSVDETADAAGFTRQRLIWRTGARSHVLTVAVAPTSTPGANESLVVRSIRVTLAPPADLLDWYDGADPPVDGVRREPNGRYLVRAELDRHRADGLFAPPATRFELPLSPGDSPRRLVVGCALLTSQGTGHEGATLFRVAARTAAGFQQLAEVSLAMPRERAAALSEPVVRQTIDVPLPAGCTVLQLETTRADPRPVGLLPAYFIDPVLLDSTPDRPRRNLVLISLDTLRADHLSAYGYQRETSPFLEELAAGAALFEDVMAPAAYTLPSHATMLTGQYPRVHRVEEVWDKIEPERSPLLAVTLRQAGYRTAAFTGGILVHSSYGFEHGFDRYSNLDPLIFDDEQAVLDWIDASRQTPFFLFVHTYNIHDFITTPDLISRFHVKGNSRLEGLIYPMWGIVDVSLGATEEDRRYVTDMYDASIAHADRFVRRIVEHLDRLGLADKTTLVITSDHGKELLDRGVLGHGHSLYQELVHVPLIIRSPGVPPRRIPQTAGTVDLTPTLLELLDLPRPDEIQGRSLVPLLHGMELPARPLLAEQIHTPFHLLALRDRAFKILRTDPLEETDQGGGKPRLLYDLSKDPGESRDLFGKIPESAALDQELAEIVERLSRLRQALDDRVQSQGPHRLRDDVLDALDQAGYVKGTATPHRETK